MIDKKKNGQKIIAKENNGSNNTQKKEARGNVQVNRFIDGVFVLLLRHKN
jgi:hypothetical protein